MGCGGGNTARRSEPGGRAAVQTGPGFRDHWHQNVRYVAAAVSGRARRCEHSRLHRGVAPSEAQRGGAPSLQITPEDVALEGLIIVRDQASAVRALHTIVEQGEDARTHAGSHYETFRRIVDEYDAWLRQNPHFQPGRPVARYPVMRKPVIPNGKLRVNDARAAPYMDVTNALYGLMLRCLGQVYAREDRHAEARRRYWRRPLCSCRRSRP
jgi:hypothetical protein